MESYCESNIISFKFLKLKNDIIFGLKKLRFLLSRSRYIFDFL